ncbi:translation initiation factor IF-2-like [Drosophila teissieri]|uniref:translation initiation factor IF-2-like n=1 Tax=Drosophila teissieri TaxID=7243 RepID=UPI001CBA3924|nr:translation initiation factor IF-2-like [Drosophila teissieri]
MSSNAQNNREVRVTGTGEQPGAIWRADSESYLQLLASPLLSRSPSPVQEDTEEVPDAELSEDEAMEAIHEEPVDYVSLSSESEEDDGGETVTPVVSSEEDEGGRSAKARMAYRSVRRATQGHARIRLGEAMPSKDPREMREFADARIATLRRFERMVVERKAAAAKAAWEKRLSEWQEEEEALWVPHSPSSLPPRQPPRPPTPPPPSQPSPPPPPPPTQQQQEQPPTPEPQHPGMPQPPTPQPPLPPPAHTTDAAAAAAHADAATPRTPVRAAAVLGSGPGARRADAAHNRPGRPPVAPANGDLDMARTAGGHAGGPRVGGGGRGRMEPVEKRARDPQVRARVEVGDAGENPEKGPWVWPAPPPPKLARQESCPEARQPPQRPCLRRQQALCGKPWKELERAEWPPRVVEEAEAQAGRSHKDRWAKLFVLDGQRFRLKVRRGGDIQVYVPQ